MKEIVAEAKKNAAEAKRISKKIDSSDATPKQKQKAKEVSRKVSKVSTQTEKRANEVQTLKEAVVLEKQNKTNKKTVSRMEKNVQTWGKKNTTYYGKTRQGKTRRSGRK